MEECHEKKTSMFYLLRYAAADGHQLLLWEEVETLEMNNLQPSSHLWKCQKKMLKFQQKHCGASSHLPLPCLIPI
jgi:hypothetical protein